MHIEKFDQLLSACILLHSYAPQHAESWQHPLYSTMHFTQGKITFLGHFMYEDLALYLTLTKVALADVDRHVKL